MCAENKNNKQNTVTHTDFVLLCMYLSPCHMALVLLLSLWFLYNVMNALRNTEMTIL